MLGIYIAADSFLTAKSWETNAVVILNKGPLYFLQTEEKKMNLPPFHKTFMVMVRKLPNYF